MKKYNSTFYTKLLQNAVVGQLHYIHFHVKIFLIIITFQDSQVKKLINNK